LAATGVAELVFVVDVSSMTKEGFVGSTAYQGRRADLKFDSEDKGVFLSSVMAKRLRVKKRSVVSIVVEGEGNQVVEAKVAGVGKQLRVSDSKVYFAIGREGGAVLRIRKG
jgi:hypothetical protein